MYDFKVPSRYESASELRVGRLELETAGTSIGAGVISGESEVTLLTPAGAPGVLNEPVVLTVVSAVANKEDTVVKRGTTGEESRALHDTTVVELEANTGGIDGDGDGTLSGGSLKSRSTLGSDISVGADGNGSTGNVALAIGSSVRVLSLGLERSGLGVLESVVHKTTTATLVTE